MSFLKRMTAGGILAFWVFGPAAYGGWKIKTDLRGRWTYDSNVFNLSGPQAARLNAGDPADQASGRFADMSRVGDHILRPSFSLAAAGPGLFGGKFELGVSLDYEFFVSNAKKNNAEMEAFLRQELWKGGVLEISGLYVPRFFKRNYLIDGVPDGTGVVLPESRIYRAGDYHEAGGAAAYEHRLLKKKRTGSFGLTARIGAGYLDRRFQDSLFRGRDRQVLALDGSLRADFKGGWEAAFIYTRESAESPIVTEVLLLDEPGFQVDLNSDGDVLDQNVRVEDGVDRSFNADTWDGILTAPLGGQADLTLSISRRSRRYLSQQEFDGYRGRLLKRWVLGAEFKNRLSSNLFLVVDYRYHIQKASSVDLTGDEDDYSKHLLRAGLRFSF